MNNDKIIVNVILDADRGSVTVASREAVCGERIGALPCPVRAGYAFAGWYLDGAPVTEDTVLTAEHDVRLVAHWTKKRGERKKMSMLKKQKLAVSVLAGVMAFLILALAAINYQVAIYDLVDVYYDEDGNEHTQKYYVKRKDGAYALYDRSGNKMEKNENGMYIALSGNQYSIDPETGESSLFAVVDFDADAGEVLAYSEYIMMFPQIDQENVFSLSVTNETGSYRFYRNAKGVLKLEGFEDTEVLYNETAFTVLCVSCAYPLTKAKLDLTSKQSTVSRLEDGSVDYSAYGLSDADNPATYTLTKATKDKNGNVVGDPNAVYTVRVGDKLLDGNGYYVQLEGRDAIYVLPSTTSELGRDIGRVFQPIESMVMPRASYPIPMVAQNMVDNFILGRVDLTGSLSNKDFLTDAIENLDMIAAFTYLDMDMRENTLYLPTPYKSLMEEYDINDINVDVVLNMLYEMQFIACRKLGLTKSVLEEYGFNGEAYYLSYGSPVLNEQNLVTGYVDNYLLISEKTENNTYYVASFLYDMIVEVDHYYLSFLDWDQNEWYIDTLYKHNVAFLTDLRIQIGDEEYNFVADNSASDQSQEISSAGIKVFCEQYLNGKKDPHQLDYTITYSYISDAGVLEYDQITGIENFMELCKHLTTFSIEGDFDAKEEKLFETAHGMSVSEYVETQKADATIFYRIEDNAATMNDYTYTDKNGVTKPYYTENNEKALVMRIYRYSERKALITAELIEGYEGGDPDSEPTKASRLFYVNYSYLNTILKDLQNIVNEYPIAPEGNPTIIS